MKGPTLFLCAALLLIVNPTIADKCRSGCQGTTPNLFKYAEGTTYKYNLESTIEISLSSAERQDTKTKVRGTVLLTQEKDCNQILRLQNVQVVGADGKKYSGLPNIDKAITVNFHDGHIEDVICTEPGDTQHSLNIKRAVASMFQAAINHHHESDVFGNCPTDISTRKEGPMTVIHKTRHLTRCSHRESIKQDFMATSFNDNSDIHSSPLLHSEYESEQKLKNGILDSAVITENYLYRPFSNGKNGAKAIVTTKLTYSGDSKDAVKEKPSVPKSIHFENPHIETSKAATLDSIVNALKETKKTMDISVSENSAKTFVQLIKVLRASKKEDILAVYGQIKSGAGGFSDKVSARKVFFDALFRTGTGDAVETMIELLKNNELSPTEQKLVFLSLSFIRHATPASLKAATQLVDMPNLPREAYLGMGTLAGHYCNEHDCEDLDELNKLMEKMSSKLTSNPGTHKDENMVIAMLKGLANIHHLSDGILDKLVSMATDKKAPARVRVAALETFLADPCKSKLRDASMKILKDREQDSEIRIKAYLAIVQCPDSKSAQQIQELLDTEPIYQVGGYIVSHLRNLRASANPDREVAKQYLSMVKTDKKFPIDPRKYSFNNEFSYTIDSAGVGSAMESNVIYSQNSFLPRSTNLNLTGEFFGHSFNFFELGTRQENLDKVFEHYFGPLGVFSTHTPEELLNTGKATAGKLAEHIRKRFEKSRGKRDVSKNDIDAFNKQVKILDHELSKNLDLDLSVKILGSEMMFLSINEDIEKLTPDAIIDKFFDFLDEGMDKAKNFEYHMKNHMMFLDVETSYPTSMGFPLRLNVEGSSAVHFITQGNVDIRSILKDPKNAQIKISVIPSANIELTGEMIVDAHFLTTGLKVTSSILTSTGGDINMKLLEDGKGIDVKMGLPVKKQTLASFKHDIVFSTQELGRPEIELPLKFKDKMKEFSICFDQLSSVIGLSFCGELNTPSTLSTNMVPFPLNGPVQMSVEIVREDVKEYHFKALLKDQKPHHKSLEILFDTPSSETKREVQLVLEAMTSPDKALRATLKSPFTSAVAEAVITDSDKEKSAMLRLQHDTNEYYGKVGVSVEGDAAKHVYKPLIEYHTPSDVVKTKGNRKPDYTVEGQIVVEKGGDKQRYTFDKVKLIVPNQPPITIDGYLEREGKKYSGDVKINREQIGVEAKGSIEASPDKISLEAQLKNTMDENLNFDIKYDMKRGPGLIENSIAATHGKDLGSKKHTLSLAQSLKYKYESAQDFNFETKNKVVYPPVGLEVKLEGKASNKHVKYDIDFAYEKFKLESELDAKVNQKNVGDYDIKFELEAMTNKVKLNAKRDVAGDKSTLKNVLEFNKKKYSVDGTVKHSFKGNDVDFGTDLTVGMHGVAEPIKIDTKLVANQKELDSHAKVTSGSNIMIDMDMKVAKGSNPNGNLKVFVNGLVDANGNFKSTEGVGDGMVLVDILKMGRKLKAVGKYTCKDPTHNFDVDVFFDFEKDNSKKMTISTHNEVTKHSVDSKNKLALLANTLTFNVKGNLDGKFNDGKLTGEFDLTLPNEHMLLGKIDRELRVKDNVANGHGHMVLEHKPNKDSKGHKFDIKGRVKDTNMKQKVFDIVHNIVAEGMDGKDIKLDIVLIHKHEGEKHNSIYKTNLHGSAMPKPVEIEVTGTYLKRVGSYKAHMSYGPDLATNIAGKYNMVGGATPVTGEVDVEVITPLEKYKNLKGHASGSVLVPEGGLEGHYEMSGKASGTLNNDKTLKVDGSMSLDKNKGNMKASLNIPDMDPMSVSADYGHEPTSPGFGKCHCGVDVHYGKGKNVKVNMKVNRPNNDEVDMEVDLHTPHEKAKHVNLVLKGKRSNEGKHLTSEFIITADGKKYSLDNELVISETAPSIDIKMTCPEAKPARILAKYVRLAPKKYTGELKLENLKDLSLDMSGEADMESVDNFHIAMNIHSDRLKLDKVKVDILNKGSKGSKKIEFSAKSGEKNLFSGSTDYKAHEEGDKFIVEGSGAFKVQEETKKANFKFIRQTLMQEKDGEHGTEVVLNAGIGTKGIVGELKLTNKQFRLLNSYCEEKSQCAHVEVFAKHNSDDVSHFHHELEVNIDLRKLGLSHEFGLKAVTNRKNFVLDHTVDVHFESSANSKYQYSLYVHPKEAGIVFTMPKRVIALESKIDGLPGDKRKGPIKGEVAFYMNKVAEPNKKTLLSFSADNNFGDKTGKTNLEVKFNNPNLAKELMLKYESKYDLPSKTAEYKIDMDIFGKKSHRITLSGLLKGSKLENGYKVISEMNAISKGFDLELKCVEQIAIQPQDLSYHFTTKYRMDKVSSDSEILAEISPKKGQLLLKLMNKELLNVDSKFQLSKENQVIDTTMSAYGVKPMVSHFELKDLNTMMYTLNKKDTPKNKLQISSGFIFGQIADFRAEILKGGNKNDLMHASLKLDDANFMKPDFGVNVENIQKMLLEPMRTDTINAIEELRKLVGEFQKTISAHIKHVSEAVGKNIPNLKPMVSYYQTELGKLKEELITDKTIQEVTDMLRRVFGATIHTISEIFQKVAEVFEKFSHIFQEHFAKMADIVAKEILPAMQQVGSKFLDFYVSILKNVYDVVAIYAIKMADFVKDHQGELKQVATVLSESFQDVGQILFKTFKHVRDELQHLLKEVYEQIKALPLFDELKERFEALTSGMPVPDHVIGIVNEILATVKDVMPTPEAKDFVSSLQEYLVKKLKQEKVDDMAMLKKIYVSFMKAINSVFSMVKSQATTPDDMKSILENLMPLPLDAMIRLPRTLAMHFSPLRLLLNGEFPHPRDLLHQVTFNPLMVIPPFQHHAIIVQGQHIFTFDERHLTFPGTCSYVLAEDIVNNNFTIIGGYKDGMMDALTFADKKDIVTLKKDLKVMLNGKESELPVRTRELDVFRLYETVNIVSKSGVRIVCQPHLIGCGIYVSGFYHGQMRGLLGNGNHEPYDDFLLPNGKIATKEDDFGNSYKVGGGCSPVKTVDHHHHESHPACESLFSADSNMRMCYPFVDTKTFKQACEHGMAAGVKDTEKAIATAYVAACMNRNIPIKTPPKYVQCFNNDKPIDKGVEFSVKLPGKAADIVIVVEQNKFNEVVFKELIQPLVTSITSDLNAKGITDVDFSLIGYGGEYTKWPSHYTSGGKIKFQGKASSLKFMDSEPHHPIHTGCSRMDEILENVFQAKNQLKIHLGLTPAGLAIREGMRYPFRAHAVKSLVFVPGKSFTEKLPLLTLIKNLVLYRQDNGLHFTVVTPAEIKMKDAKQQKNVIGFDDHEVYTFADAKKKQGNAELRKDLEYDDVPADFVMRNHGNVFLSSNFVAAKPGQKKTFVQMMSHTMVDDMVNTEQHLDCECTMVNPFDAKNICHVTSTKNIKK